jgi:hypothetical protein
LINDIQILSTRVSEVEAGRESYRTRFLEEREAKKCLEEDVKRVQKECRAKLSMMSTETDSQRPPEMNRHR